ncbi:AMP-binding protein [Pseudolysinimonas kribbensis]|uniref:AMP-binding protein n=1 Tax=Pseudolysinimonas kribbensis TaxID=433641 RepID=UPI0024E101FC|nr:AMP-binding protein [Pseudolysinimonas kribbensis]
MIDLARLNVRDFFDEARAASPEAPFVIFTTDDRAYSFREAGGFIDRAAAAWHELGVRHGDRVAFMLGNTPEFLWAWLGLARIGGVLVAINTGFREAEAGYLVRDSGARIALADDEFAGMLAPAGRPVLTPAEFGALAARSGLDPAPAVDLAGDDLISLIYTSGTTGDPKGVMQTHRNFVLTGQAYIDWMRMEPGERIYACLPLFHINSQAYSTMAAIAARGALVLAPRFSASRFWPDVRRHRVSVFNFIGAMAMILTKSQASPDDADNHVRIAYGVPALAVEVVDEIEARFGLRCISGFGMSETTFGLLEPSTDRGIPARWGCRVTTPTRACRPPRRRSSTSRAPRCCAARGELLLRNAAMMSGYFGLAEKTAETLVEGWLHTGDSAYQDDDGFFFFVDRMKDIVRRRGENVSSLEVERVIARHPSIAEAAVIGVPAELSDEELLVFVVPRDGVDAAPLSAGDVFAWAAEHLAPFKVPRYLRFADALPKTATAKVQKERLRAMDADDPAGRIVREPDRRDER